MAILIKAAQFFLSLSLLIIIHELGHFLFARIFKCRVEKFYLFFNFGFSLFKTKRGETEYGIGWLPLGGYVKIAGMIDESMDREQMKKPPQPWEFRSKKPIERLLIMVGGVLMNFLAALIIYIGVLYTWGEEYLPAENARFGIEASETAEEIGFRDGDFILSVDHQPVDDFYNIVPTIVLEGAESVQVRRNGIETEVLIDTDDIAVMMKTRNLIGLRFPFKMLITDFGKESPAREAGMLKGDEVLRINGMEFEFHDQFVCELNKHRDEELQVTVRRDSQLIDIPLRLTAEGMMGVQWNNNFSEYFEFKTIEYGFWESIPAGIL